MQRLPRGTVAWMDFSPDAEPQDLTHNGRNIFQLKLLRLVTVGATIIAIILASYSPYGHSIIFLQIYLKMVVMIYSFTLHCQLSVISQNAYNETRRIPAADEL